MRLLFLQGLVEAAREAGRRRSQTSATHERSFRPRHKSKDKIVYLHYFVGGCDWWIAELDPDEMLAFGYACLGSPQDAEWGYVSLTELEQIVAGAALGTVAVVERDLYWTPKSVAECDLPGFR